MMVLRLPHRLRVGWPWALALFACAEASQVAPKAAAPGARLALAAEPPVIEQGACVGTRCDASAIAPQPADYAQPVACEIAPPEPLAVRARATLGAECGSIGMCEPQWNPLARSVAIAPDGSAWLARAVRSPTGANLASGLLLEHHVGVATPNRWVVDVERGLRGDRLEHSVKLVVDDRNHVFLSLGKYVFRRGDAQPTASRWLYEFGPTGEAIGAPLPISDSLQPWPSASAPAWVHPAGDGRLALGPSAYGESALGLLSTDTREALWTQSRDRLPRPFAPRPDHAQPRWVGFREAEPQPFSMVADRDGGIGVMTYEPYSDAEQRQQPSIERYAPDGALAWVRTFPPPWGRELWSTLSSGRDGDLIQAGYRFTEGTGERSELWVHKLAPDGHSLWLTTLGLDSFDYPAGVPRANITEDGTIYIGGVQFNITEPVPEDPTSLQTVSAGVALFRISADGTSCRRFEVAADDLSLSDLFASPRGELYLLGYDTFVRLEARP
jgi:hypothetical protein